MSLEDLAFKAAGNPYVRSVAHLDEIDVYRIITLYNVTDPCLQHALKKILCAGARGAKPQAQDICEAIESLLRWKAMQNEDAAGCRQTTM